MLLHNHGQLAFACVAQPVHVGHVPTLWLSGFDWWVPERHLHGCAHHGPPQVGRADSGSAPGVRDFESRLTAAWAGWFSPHPASLFGWFELMHHFILFIMGWSRGSTRIISVSSCYWRFKVSHSDQQSSEQTLPGCLFLPAGVCSTLDPASSQLTSLTTCQQCATHSPQPEVRQRLFCRLRMACFGFPSPGNAWARCVPIYELHVALPRFGLSRAWSAIEIERLRKESLHGCELVWRS